MDNKYEYVMLLDFYGQMLTQKQFEILDLYYNNDYSLGEISNYLEISRQAVYDNLKRGKNSLVSLEDKLSLIKRFNEYKIQIEKIDKILEELDLENINIKDKDRILEIKNLLNALSY